jgi:hypothetical protein
MMTVYDHGNELLDPMKCKVRNCSHSRVPILPAGLVTTADTPNDCLHFCMGVTELLFSSESTYRPVHNSSYF